LDNLLWQQQLSTIFISIAIPSVTDEAELSICLPYLITGRCIIKYSQLKINRSKSSHTRAESPIITHLTSMIGLMDQHDPQLILDIGYWAHWRVVCMVVMWVHLRHIYDVPSWDCSTRQRNG
jgi:hypothetical protein